MCQLLAMNANCPTDIGFSFTGFRARGGITDHHTDGFGIAFFEEDGGLRLFRDNQPCAVSPVADWVRDYPIRSQAVIAHLRRASQGQTTLANTHPFVREIWGRHWVFAHNGDIRYHDLIQQQPLPTPIYSPVGNTDSEWAFCWLLNHLRDVYPQGAEKQLLFAHIHHSAQQLAQHGLINFILSNGQWLMAHCGSLLHYIQRQAPFGHARLIDQRLSIDFASVTTPNDRVAVVSTLPLTADETWQQMAIGETLLFENGRVVSRLCPANPYYPSREEGLAMARAAGAA